MHELYGVGGAICAAPETCTDCGKNPPVRLIPRAASNSSNNWIEGLCQVCLDHRAAVSAWEKAHPGEAKELFALVVELSDVEAVAKNPESAGAPWGGQCHRRWQARIPELEQKIKKIKSELGYPVR